ncbi:C40 family peptidase (plasmid) [Streptomyces sp. BI20]|uniref:C40 family peptidase n=1 Tax=Streptomyces sp. BI20 TaxID=3403460 RepID=UPI003C71C578
MASEIVRVLPAASRDVAGPAGQSVNAGWDAVRRYRGVPPESFAGGETYGYVKEIRANITMFEDAAAGVGGRGSRAEAVRKAMGVLGTPYSWGGGGPNGPSRGFCDGGSGYLNGVCVAATTVGFDCSGLTGYAFHPTVKLPRTAGEQYRTTSDHPVSKNNYEVGDLLFWARGGSGDIYHVGL